MPVVGHAFVGLATAMQFGPASVRDRRQPTPIASAWWAPAVVVASYFPDIVTQVGGAVGVSHANAYGHSLAVGVVAGAALGGIWSAAAGTPLTRAVVIAIGSILGHDVLDVLQAMSWPWSGRPSRATFARRNASSHLVGLLFAMFPAMRIGTGRRSASSCHRRSQVERHSLMPAIVAAILIAAVGTYPAPPRAAERRQTASEAAATSTRSRCREGRRLAARQQAWPRRHDSAGTARRPFRDRRSAVPALVRAGSDEFLGAGRSRRALRVERPARQATSRTPARGRAASALPEAPQPSRGPRRHRTRVVPRRSGRVTRDRRLFRDAWH